MTETTEQIRICVNGSRTFNDPKLMDDVLRKRIPIGQESLYKLIVGGARGADQLAQSWAEKNKVDYQIFPAFWDLYGKSAGYKRNVEMIDNSDELISFHDGVSKGTLHAIQYAKSKSIKTTIVHF